MSSNTLQNFMVYAPDYTDEGALERRLKVRQQHLTDAKGLHEAGFMKLGGGLLSPETTDANPSKLIGSMCVVRAQSIAEVREKIESDVYWTAGVWDKERLVIAPFLIAPFFNTFE